MIRIIEKPLKITTVPNIILKDPQTNRIKPIGLRGLDKYEEINSGLMYTRTLAGIGKNLVEDLSLRSSWTNKCHFYFSIMQNFSNEVEEFFTRVDIDDTYSVKSEPIYYQLIKYELGDFFAKHLDTQINGYHQYTCLIFLPQADGLGFEGGDLILTNSTGTFCSTIKTSDFKEITMVIFSLDLFHEITPITRGKRYVLKKPLFIRYLPKTRSLPRDINQEVDDLLGDGAFESNFFGDSADGDY